MPGKAPILSLAVTDKGFLAGTADGLWVSQDGRDWVKHPKLSTGRVTVTHSGGALAAARGSLYLVPNSNQAVKIQALTAAPSAMFESGSIRFLVAATGDGRFFVSRGRGPFQELKSSNGPREVIAVASRIEFDNGVLFAGGLVSGLWRASVSGGVVDSWERLNSTPLTAIAMDPDHADKVLVGTPGGILLSEDGGHKWKFTTLRASIEGLASARGEFFALADRFVFHSRDGDKDWRAVGT